jgi:hypothetical protein
LTRWLGRRVAESDDDDLDAFEKAARRALHGEKNIPPTSATPAETPQSVAGSPEDALLEAFRQIPPYYAASLIMFAEALARAYKGGR